jgi:crotonobetainyl-CoA:carnitine CoA-transferase CaiB-like acyl-CoA transferase
MGNRDPQLSPNGVFPCHLEGNEAESWVAISVRSDDEWQTLARLIDGETLALDPRFITLTQRQTNENALEALLANWTQRCSAIEIEHQLQAASIPAHKVASTHDMAKDPQLIAREHFIQLPHSLMGTSVVESARFKLSETPGNPELSAPTFGRDSHYVLAEILNYNEEAISQLSENGILQ